MGGLGEHTVHASFLALPLLLLLLLDTGADDTWDDGEGEQQSSEGRASSISLFSIKTELFLVRCFFCVAVGCFSRERLPTLDAEDVEDTLSSGSGFSCGSAFVSRSTTKLNSAPHS